MLPNPMGGPPQGVPSPMRDPGRGPMPGAPSGPGGEPGPDEIKAQIKQLLVGAKKLAESKGINFSEIVSELTDNKIKSDIPLPRPPGP